LQTLQQDVGGTLRGLGFAVGDEPYHPHITLGRVRNDDGERVRLRDLPDAVKNRFVDRDTGAAVSPPSLQVPVREVVLMRSHLGKEGARHEPIAIFPLGGSGSERQ
jgi:2'-5' RNA ligase